MDHICDSRINKVKELSLFFVTTITTNLCFFRTCTCSIIDQISFIVKKVELSCIKLVSSTVKLVHIIINQISFFKGQSCIIADQISFFNGQACIILINQFLQWSSFYYHRSNWILQRSSFLHDLNLLINLFLVDQSSLLWVRC